METMKPTSNHEHESPYPSINSGKTNHPWTLNTSLEPHEPITMIHEPYKHDSHETRSTNH